MNSLFIVYIILWILLVRHWWRRKVFFPLLGPGRATRIWWGVLFLLFNPLLMILYLIYGVFHHPEKVRGKAATKGFLIWSRVIVFGTTALVVLLFKIPWSGDLNQVHILRRGEPDTAAPLKAKVTTYTSQCHTSSGTSTGTGGMKCLAARRILISNTSDHPLMEKVGRQMQRTLVELPFVEEVAYYPYGSRPESATLLPDAFVTLRMPGFKRNRLPMRRSVEADVVCEVSRSGPGARSSTFYSNDPPLISFTMNVSIHHESTVVGVESPSAVYDQEAGSISKAITEKVMKDFTDMADENGLLPDLPPRFYGPYEPAPNLPFDRFDSADKLLDGHGLMIRNCTVWTYRDDRTTKDAMVEIRDILAKDGWTGGQRLEADENPLALHLKRGGEYLTVFRREVIQPSGYQMSPKSDVFFQVKRTPEKPPPPPAPEPMVAKYEKRFSKTETESAVMQFIEEGADPEVLMLFVDHVQSGPEKKRLREKLADIQPATIRGCLKLAELFIAEEETKKAWSQLARARALQRCNRQHQFKMSDIKRLAKKLGDEKFVEQPIPEDAFREVGLLPARGLTNTVKRTVSFNEPFGFYATLDPEPGTRPKKDTVTYVYKVLEQPMTDPNPQREKRSFDPRDQWRLLVMEQRNYMSSTGYRQGDIREDIWTVQDYMSAREAGCTSVKIQVRQVGDGRFEFSAEPNR